jgi:hypothetical protein
MLVSAEQNTVSSRRTGSSIGLADHVQSLVGVYSVLFQEKLRPRRARARFAVWSGRIRTLDAFFKSVVNGGVVPYVAWGDAEFSPAQRGGAPVPTKSVLARA